MVLKEKNPNIPADLGPVLVDLLVLVKPLFRDNKRPKFSYDFQEEVDVRPFVDKESDRMSIDRDLQNEVRRRPRLDGLPQDPVVMAVNQRLVEIQHQRLPFHET